MTRFVVDVPAILQIVSGDIEVSSKHQLFAPTLLRSQALSMVHEAVHSGTMNQATGRRHLAAINKLPIRLLGDAVLRRRAWEIADQLGWASTYDAEYVALTQLQADAFVTLNAKLARALTEIVRIASIDDLS